MSFRTIIVSLISCVLLLVSPSASALVDTNANGLSDLWEKLFNNSQLFSSANPDHAPAADPDKDGWTNLQEAAAGTNPFDGNPPTGLVRPEISYTPGTFDESDPPPNPPSGGGGEDPFGTGTTAPTGPPRILIDPPLATLTWPTIAGKTYQVFVSENLVDWTPASDSYVGSGDPQSFQSENVYSDGTLPPKVFLRIVIGDTDSDGDTLSDWEEGQLTLDPFSPDTDRDGIPDNTDPLPKTSATLADPDGLGLENAGLLTGLKANWTFEETSIPLGTLFGKNEARCENRAPTTTPSWPVLVPFNLQGTPFFSRRGFVSHGLPIADKSIFGDGKVFTGITNSFTLSFWHRFQKDSIRNGNTVHKCLWSLSNSSPSTSSIESNTLAVRRKNATEEEIYLGAYTWDNNGGNPKSTILGKSFTRPLGKADDGKWHQYTIVRSGGKFTLLIDGVIMPGLNDQAVTWLTIPLTKTTPTTVADYNYDWNTFGRMAPNLPQNQALGTFDRIRIWSRPLDSTEQQKLYHEDLDKDGLWDVSENNTEIWTDANRNDIREAGEYGFRSSPFIWENTVRDTDGDGLSDLDEQNIHHTDIAHPDTDGDLLPDGWEVENGLDPLEAHGLNEKDGAIGDPDGDGANNLQEFQFVSDPHNPDSDGDETNDGAEIANGSNPSDPSDNGQPLPPDKSVTILLGIGDQSDSDSEDYNMNIFRIDPETGQEIRFHTHRSGGHGDYEEKTRSIFHKGQTYTMQIDWQSSTQGSSGYDPNAPDKGPDYDYTFKAEPQTSYLGKLIDSWNADTGATDPNNPLLGTGKQNVADTQQQFEENYETRRVALVSPTLEWEAIEGFDNLDDHTDPWSTAGEKKGKRIFPGQKDPVTHRTQHKLHLIAKGGLKGIECYVKSFDIDDSTSEAFDTEGIVDSNNAGDDNRPDYLTTNLTGHFWDNQLKKWGGATSHKPFDEDGRASFDFRVGMQPGNNYRAVASISDTQAYANVQTSSSTQNTYLGPELTQNGNAIASEPLTVWRRLWVENDSMAAIPEDTFGNKRNDLNSDREAPIIHGIFTGNGNAFTEYQIDYVNDLTSFESLENGRFKVGGVFHDVSLTRKVPPGVDQDAESYVTLTGTQTGISANMGYRLYDDDGFGLAANPLPRTDLISDDIVKNVYRPAFIEIVDANSYGNLYNSNKIVEFFRNHPLVVGTFANQNAGVWDDAKDIFGKKSLWAATVVAGYQGDVNADGDPYSEGPPDDGLTPGRSPTFHGDAKYSVVFVEHNRDILESNFRNTPNDHPALNTEVDLRIKLTAAHEIGHHPQFLLANAHHDEGALMQEGGYKGFGNVGPDTKFSPDSIKRFRSTLSWQKE